MAMILITVQDLADGNVVRTYAGATDQVTAVGVTKDGAKVVASSIDKAVRIWNLPDAAVVLMEKPVEDAMGHGAIAYWPWVQVAA